MRIADARGGAGSAVAHHGLDGVRAQQYGEQLIGLALKILRGEPVPPAVYLEHTFVKAESKQMQRA